jgi:hypothetical protein
MDMISMVLVELIVLFSMIEIILDTIVTRMVLLNSQQYLQTIGLDRRDVVDYISNHMVEVFGLLNVRVTHMVILQRMVVVETAGTDGALVVDMCL